MKTTSRCTLCPAGCELMLASAGPDACRVEYPLQPVGGCCARGSALVELITHTKRILTPTRRYAGSPEAIDLDVAVEAIATAAADGAVILLDGNTPPDQIAAAAAWCRSWPGARLCLVLEPQDQQLLTGTELSGADYLAASDLADCDGFVIVGDPFAANPACSRGVFDRREQAPRTPIIAIDSAAGTASKFATHTIPTPPGTELAALAALAAAAGVQVDEALTAGPTIQCADAATAITGCERLGVLVSAEYGRSANFLQIGYLAGLLAKARGGGVVAATEGSGALTAVRMARALETISLAEALAEPGATRVAIGCDVLGMLGRSDLSVFAAAAGLPNRTTDAAEIILPVAMPGEMAGSYPFDGQAPSEIAPLLAPPAGVATPAELIEKIARAAGARELARGESSNPAGRVSGQPAAAVAPGATADCTVLLYGRNPLHSGCGSLTGHGGWQQAVQPRPRLRINPAQARQLGASNLQQVCVSAGERSVEAELVYADEVPAGTIVLTDGLLAVRDLNPYGQGGAVSPAPVTVSICP